MLALIGIGVALAVLSAPKRSSSLGDVPALPSGEELRDEGVEVFLLMPKDFAHPALRQKVAERAEAEGGPWAVVPSSGWTGAKHFPTARQARTALKAAGFKGPSGKGAFSKWVR